MSYDFSGRNVVITGGAGVIGGTTARYFVEAGARVFLSDIDARALTRARGDLAGAAGSIVCDIRDPAQCDAMIAAAEDFFGAPVDIFLANAGRPFSGALQDAPVEEIRAVIEVNVTGSILSAQAALRSLVRGRDPSLLFTASLQSVSGRAQRSVYTASKHAIAGLIKSLALELGPMGIRVNGIAPTLIDTPFLQQAYDRIGLDVETGLARAAAGLPLGRIPTADDFAQAALFLASPAAASVTGHVLMLDCGASVGKF